MAAMRFKTGLVNISKHGHIVAHGCTPRWCVIGISAHGPTGRWTETCDLKWTQRSKEGRDGLRYNSGCSSSRFRFQ
jgi:hypothetical protein